MRSGRARAGVDDRPDMLATQRGGDPARHEPVHDLHALEVARGRHDLEERAVERQRGLVFREVGGARLADELRPLPIGAIRVDVINPSTSSTIVRPAAPSASASRNAPVSAR